jgi:hypothetical protein
MNQDETARMRYLEQRCDRLVDAILEALAPLGGGNCEVNTCEGCKYETKEAVAILKKALAEQIQYQAVRQCKQPS